MTGVSPGRLGGVSRPPRPAGVVRGAHLLRNYFVTRTAAQREIRSQSHQSWGPRAQQPPHLPLGPPTLRAAPPLRRRTKLAVRPAVAGRAWLNHLLARRARSASGTATQCTRTNHSLRHRRVLPPKLWRRGQPSQASGGGLASTRPVVHSPRPLPAAATAAAARVAAQQLRGTLLEGWPPPAAALRPLLGLLLPLELGAEEAVGPPQPIHPRHLPKPRPQTATY
jgi:hypothetical protein